MRLKTLKLAGFKSFVDPVALHFPGNRVGIVGPNGCGKSNLIDAVRWAMGESAAGRLRGDLLVDVVFNGAAGRKPVGQAVVELLFDNAEGRAGGRYAAYREIAVRRTVDRDGQSTFALNGTRCRRRDILELFLGTGLGPRSYAIIEQGSISRLVESRPEELRLFIEEAAGVSKYRERRRETEGRIRRARENLQRVADLRDGVERRVKQLERQAAAAEKYRALKGRERLVHAQLMALDWRARDAEVERQSGATRRGEVQLEAGVAAQRAVEADVERLRQRRSVAADRLDAVQERCYGVGAEIARAEETLRSARQRLDDLREAQRTAEAERRDLAVHLRADRERIAEWTPWLEREGAALAAAQREAETLEEALRDGEERRRIAQEAWERFAEAAAEPERTAHSERTALTHLEARQQELRMGAQRLDEERQRLADAPSGEAADLRRAVAALEAQLNDARARLETLDGEIDALRGGAVEERLDALRGRLQELRGRRASLETLRQGRLADGAAAWIAAAGRADAPRLAAALEVDAGWERAVETVLGERLEALCVDDFETLLRRLAAHEEERGLGGGQLDLVDADAVAAAARAPGDADAPPRLIDHVRAPWPRALAALLDGVYAVEGVEEALRLRARLPAGASAATRDGLWLNGGWARVARRDDADGADKGALRRERELRALHAEQERVEEELRLCREQAERDREALRQLEQRRAALQAEAAPLHQEYARRAAALSARRARDDLIRTRGAEIDREEGEATARIAANQQEIAAARERLDRALAQIDENAARRARLHAERAALQATCAQAREAARAQRDAVHALTLRIETVRANCESTQRTLERLKARRAQQQERRDALQRELQEAEQPLEPLRQRLEALLVQRAGLEEELSAARRDQEAADDEMRAQEERRAAAERAVGDLREALERLRLDGQEARVLRRTLEEQLKEGGFEPAALLAELPAEADKAEWRGRLEAIGRKIVRLGAINLAAIDEFRDESERQAYLERQQADLTGALETLEGAIRRIDRESSARFHATFDQINARFGRFFARLFGGGRARLQLIDAASGAHIDGDAARDAGVILLAHPPGKRASTIHLLSGGEKALAAAALIFAIFALNPAPFCLLDEVDAPLDDVNVARYCDLVREMSERTQILFVTHNKGAMEMAEQLIGVTMSEPGVSRIVAVDVEGARALAGEGA